MSGLDKPHGGKTDQMMRRFTSRFVFVVVVALTAAFIAPAFATAQTLEPTEGQYGDTLTQINQGANPGGPGGPEGPGGEQAAPPAPEQPTGALDQNVGPLPFTGFDVIAMAAVALAVAGLGLALQRAVSRSPQQ
jgi:hypothetical protein